jgi:hypothetical protein
VTVLPRRWWVPALLVAAGLLVLYAGPLRTRFLHDDYLFLEQARTRPLAESLLGLDALGNFYRPVSRQLYFAALTPVLGGDPRVFHAVNFAIFLAALALLADLLASLAPAAGVLAGVTVFALMPLQAVNLTWISCSQDLLALLFALLSLALFRRGRDGWAAAAYLLAAFSKESALPLPVVLAAWARLFGHAPWRAVLRRLTPFAGVAGAWLVATLVVRSGHSGAATFLSFAPGNFVAAYVHLVQSVVGLEHPAGFLRALASPRLDLPALALFAALALWLVPARGAAPATAGTGPPPPVPTRSALAFGLAWVLAFGFVTGPVAAIWSAYFYTLAAAGVAIVVAVWARRLTPLGWLVLVPALLTVHGTARANRAFAARDDAWGWTSHLTSYYFERVAALSESLSVQLVRLEPHPEPGTRFFFSLIPSYAGFQQGNGALIRSLYRDPTLESWFYSQFSDSTAGWHPCRFVSFNGQTLAPLYDPRTTRDLFFQVGTDLLVLDRPRGALHAFQRGLAAGESRFDHLYWTGWTELFLGRRGEAEAAWTAAGMREDTAAWFLHMRIARQALDDQRDTLAARRALVRAIQYGPGHPEPHAVLGVLLLPSAPKYGLLELRVATWLKPNDWLARRDLIGGLLDQGLDDAAAREMETLKTVYPGWASDSLVAADQRRLAERRAPPAVVEF